MLNNYSSRLHIKNIISIFLLLIVDIAAYFVSFILAYFTRMFIDDIFHITPLMFSLKHLVITLWWVPAIFIVMIAYKNLYTLKKPFWHESRRLILSCFFTLLIVLSIVSLGKMSNYVSRLFLIILFIYMVIFVTLFRYIMKTKVLNKRFFAESLVIIGCSNYLDNVKNSIIRENGLCFYVVGVVLTDTPDNYTGSQKVLGNIKDIEKIIAEYNISSAVVIKNEIDKSFENVLNNLQIKLNKLLIVLDSQGIGFSNTEAVQLLQTGLNYLQINNNFKSLLNSIVKRCSDIILSIIMLPFLMVIIIIIAVLIKATSRGSVFYGHTRVGRNGKTFKVLKFRSMYQDADERLREILKNNEEARHEWNTYYKLKNDPRITKVGRFLRKSSLDELPQIFNVLKGDMSFVGPRPVIQDELDKYYRELSSYYYMVRPGITGLWQISGRNELNYDERVAKDAWYVLNWSIWLDLVILFKTPGVVFKKKGAY